MKNKILISIAILSLVASTPIASRASVLQDTINTIQNYTSTAIVQAVQSIAKLKVSKYLNLTGYLKNSKGDVKVDDNLKVTGNITTSDGKTVDGVDVSSLSGFTGKSCTSGQMLKWDGDSWECSADIDTNTELTAGANVSITNGVISKTDTDTTYTAGNNISITNGVISKTDTDTTYTAGSGVAVNGSEITVSSGGVTRTMLTNYGCSANQILKWDGVDSWDCASDADTGSLLGATVESAEITDNTIMNADIKVTAAIALSKLATGTSAYVLLANAGGTPTYTAISGDATITNTGVLTLGSSSVGSQEVKDGDLGNADFSSSAAIGLSKLATGTDAQIIIANSSGIPTYYSLNASDAAISNSGVLSLNTDSVHADDLSSGALATNGGLGLNGGLEPYPGIYVKVPSNGAGGLQTDASGLAVYLDSNSGLQTTTGLKIDLDGSTLSLTASGLKVGTLTDAVTSNALTLSGTTINNSAIGANNPSTVAATTLSTTGLANFASMKINGEAKKISDIDQKTLGSYSRSLVSQVTVVGTAMTIANDGYPSIAYFSDAVGTDTLYFMHCGNTSCSSGNSTPVAIDTVPDTFTGRDISMILSGATNNYPIIFFTDYSAPSYTVKAVYCNDNNCSSSTSRDLVTDSTIVLGEYLSANLMTSGFPIVAYTNDPTGVNNQTLKSIACTLADCSTVGSTVELDSYASHNVGDYVDSVIAVNGYPLFAYLQSTDGDLREAHCSSASCSGTVVTTTITDTVTVDGEHTSITVGADGYPIITYDAGVGDHPFIGYTKCLTYNCNDTMLDVDYMTPELTTASYSTSILGEDGNITVGYYSGTAGVSAVHCFNKECTTTTGVKTVESSSDDIGSYLSMASGANGRPVFVYYNATDSSLDYSVAGSYNLLAYQPSSSYSPTTAMPVGP